MNESTMTEPLLSVAVITYNHAKWIQQCFDGIGLQQVTFPFEVCIGDDGSSDGTTEICADFAARSHRGFTVVHQVRDRKDPSRKSYDAVFMPNAVATLRSCHGRYVAIVEGDDFWTNPAKLQSQIQFLEEHSDYSMVIHNATISCHPPQANLPHWIDTRQRPEFLQDRDFGPLNWPTVLFPSGSVVVRREVVDLLINSQLAFGPAWDSTMLFLAGTRGKIRFLADPMGCYRIHAGACWNGPLSGDRYEVMLKFSSRLLKYGVDINQDVQAWLQTLFDYNYLCVANQAESDAAFRQRMKQLFPEGTEAYHRSPWLTSTATESILSHVEENRKLRQSRSFRLGRTIVDTLRSPLQAVNWLRGIPRF
jgi:hypothetical protein